jgi:hypothetical protein
VVAALVHDVRARGLHLALNGSRLRVSGDPAAYTPALRATLLANKAEIVAYLQREEDAARATYDRDERAWAAEYLEPLALARGYAPELARVAADVVRRAPPRSPFRVERDLIVIVMGEGIEVRVHREPQPWAAGIDEKESSLSPR